MFDSWSLAKETSRFAWRHTHLYCTHCFFCWNGAVES